jgi:hypothetical protein
MKIRMMKTSQMTKREITRLSLNMLMMGQLKDRKPRMNRKNHVSLFIFPLKPPKIESLPLGDVQCAFISAATAGYAPMCSFVSYHISCSNSISEHRCRNEAVGRTKDGGKSGRRVGGQRNPANRPPSFLQRAKSFWLEDGGEYEYVPNVSSLLITETQYIYPIRAHVEDRTKGQRSAVNGIRIGTIHDLPAVLPTGRTAPGSIGKNDHVAAYHDAPPNLRDAIPIGIAKICVVRFKGKTVVSADPGAHKRALRIRCRTYNADFKGIPAI